MTAARNEHSRCCNKAKDGVFPIYQVRARLELGRSQQQESGGGGNEKNANLAAEILHLASLMRDQADQGRGQL